MEIMLNFKLQSWNLLEDLISEKEYQDIQFRLLLTIENEGMEQMAYVDLTYDILHQPVGEVLFSSVVKPVKI